MYMLVFHPLDLHMHVDQLDRWRQGQGQGCETLHQKHCRRGDGREAARVDGALWHHPGSDWLGDFSFLYVQIPSSNGMIPLGSPWIPLVRSFFLGRGFNKNHISARSFWGVMRKRGRTVAWASWWCPAWRGPPKPSRSWTARSSRAKRWTWPSRNAGEEVRERMAVPPKGNLAAQGERKLVDKCGRV